MGKQAVSSALVGGAAFSFESIELAKVALALRIPAAAVIFSVVRKSRKSNGLGWATTLSTRRSK
jgi:hypothetical protein